MVSHLDLLWNRSTRELGYGLFNSQSVFHLSVDSRLVLHCLLHYMIGLTNSRRIRWLLNLFKLTKQIKDTDKK